MDDALDNAGVHALFARLRLERLVDGSTFILDAGFFAAPGVTILYGPSGAGKTTILQCLAGLLRPDSGRISVGADAWFDSRAGIARRRRSVGYVFQDVALFPHLTVEANVRYGIADLAEREQRERTAGILERFHIADLRGRRPREISGGERQRTALARSLVTDPELLLLDEPLSALDAVTKARILDDLRAWNESHRIPILLVTHSRDEVFAIGERVIAVENGKIVAQGTPREVLETPRQLAMAQLAGFENIFDATIVAEHRESGTMTCRVAPGGATLEAPLSHLRSSTAVRLAIHAGDILLAAAEPKLVSARNVLRGTIAELRQIDVSVIAEVDCGVRLRAKLTPGARDALALAPGSAVWAVIKTHSCHIVS